MKEDLLFYNEYEQFYDMAAQSEAFKLYCRDAFGADFSQDGFSDLSQINTILSYLPKKEDLHILDIGCGNGKMLKYLQTKTNAFIYGFDYSENAIETARTQNTEKADFRVGIIGETEYPKEQFDAIISMDSIYFAKDMHQFVGQVRSWLKEDGRFLIGYQEGDVMPKTANSETTVVAQALRANHFNYQVTDITEETYLMLKRKRESVLKFREEFLKEGLEEWFQMVLGQTDCAEVSLEEYGRQNARYLFIAEKKK